MTLPPLSPSTDNQIVNDPTTRASLLRRSLQQMLAFGGLIAIFIVFSIASPEVFPSYTNVIQILFSAVVIARWLVKNSDVLIFDEPTRGIDVGAKDEIYHLLNRLASDGKSIIMISSELPEVLRLSHRIVVMSEGRVTGIVSAGDATQETIMALATHPDDELQAIQEAIQEDLR